ncbi:transporter suffix domain-containing protein [Lacrimispora xylanisolvens]|uniref:transporter suffix domain-containing protein n=1 Tax=Lacrimispora xylanisolvens TaxID=384636 RepID=UPI002402AB45|nr:transporter suffix domain-containing protein [Paenibacillaceae bacterium]
MECDDGNRKKVYRIIAISLIVMSFVLYAIMPFNACLPFSVCTIAGITGIMMAISEVIFWVGSLMIGRDVALKIRKKYSIRTIVNHIKDRKQG